MPPRKRKSSKKPSLSRSVSMDETTHPQNPKTDHLHEDDDDDDVQHIQNPNLVEPKDSSSNVQNPISIEEEDTQDLNPQPDNPHPQEKGDDLLEIQTIDDKPQTENNHKGGDLEGEVSKGDEDQQIDPEGEATDDQLKLVNVSRRAHKRKKRQKGAALEKKLKQIQDPISIEEDEEKQGSEEAPTTGSIPTEQDSVKGQNLQAVEQENEGNLELEEMKNTPVLEEQKPQPETQPDQVEDLECAMDSEEFEQKNEDEEEQKEQQGKEEEEENNQINQEEPQGMDLSPPLHIPPADEGLMLGLMLDNQPSASNVSRKAPKKKKLNHKQQAALEKKLKRVKENLQPIPFAPEKKLDFSKHEELFKRLGLWDFVNLEFDQFIRSDLLAMLIASYNPSPSARYSTVNDHRIKLSRADLARALKLPVKKDKTITLETSDFDMEALPEESISFLSEFMSNWVLLHDDMWILPPEVLNWEALIKKGEPHKVDWPALIWYMVEKELTQAPEKGKLYYASHLQCLMKSQRVDLFKEEARLFKEEARLDVSTDDEEDAGDQKMGAAEDYRRQDMENQETELCLGLDKNESEQLNREEAVMDYQEYKQEPGGSAQWLLDGKNNMTDHCLRRCNLTEIHNLESQEVMKEQNDDTYDPQSRCSDMEGLTSTDLLQAIGTTNVTYSPPGLRLRGHSSGDFFQAGVDTHLSSGGMSMFGNDYKRELSHDEFAANHTLSGHNLRMRNNASSEFNFHMEQIYNSMNKVREMYEEKEAHMNNNLLVSELQQQNSDLQHQCAALQQQNAILMDNVHKIRYELQRKDVHANRLDNELLVMKRLLEGYRKALHENRRAFAVYRELNPKPEEPLYRDVGPGGTVLSTREIEKLRLERQEEEKLQRCLIEQMFTEFQCNWFDRLEGCSNDVHHLDSKLMEFEESVKLCKETFEKRKVAEI